MIVQIFVNCIHIPLKIFLLLAQFCENFLDAGYRVCENPTRYGLDQNHEHDFREGCRSYRLIHNQKCTIVKPVNVYLVPVCVLQLISLNPGVCDSVVLHLDVGVPAPDQCYEMGQNEYEKYKFDVADPNELLRSELEHLVKLDVDVFEWDNFQHNAKLEKSEILKVEHGSHAADYEQNVKSETIPQVMASNFQRIHLQYSFLEVSCEKIEYDFNDRRHKSEQDKYYFAVHDKEHVLSEADFQRQLEQPTTYDDKLNYVQDQSVLVHGSDDIVVVHELCVLQSDFVC